MHIKTKAKKFSFDRWKKMAKLLFSSFGDWDSENNHHFFNIYVKRGRYYLMGWREGVPDHEKPTEFHPCWARLLQAEREDNC